VLLFAYQYKFHETKIYRRSVCIASGPCAGLYRLRQEGSQSAPAVAAPAPAVVAKPALDKDAILLAAQDYFAQLAIGNNMVNAADLKKMLADNPDALFLIDIRRATDFEA
jgi:hypothetical protein